MAAFNCVCRFAQLEHFPKSIFSPYVRFLIIIAVTILMTRYLWWVVFGLAFLLTSSLGTWGFPSEKQTSNKKSLCMSISFLYPESARQVSLFWKHTTLRSPEKENHLTTWDHVDPKLNHISPIMFQNKEYRKTSNKRLTSNKSRPLIGAGCTGTLNLQNASNYIPPINACLQ